MNEEFLNNTESNHPGTKENVLESFKQILDVENIRTVLNECERCGEPTSAKICKACEIKDIVSENLKKNKFYFIIGEQNKFCQKKEKRN